MRKFSSSGQSHKVAAVSLFAGTLLFFSNSLWNQFVWDDEQFVLKNTFLTSWEYFPKLFTENLVAGAGVRSNLYRPLQLVTHFFDVRLWGYAPFGHHLFNLILHAFLAVAVFHILLRYFSLWPSFLAAAWFSIYPLQSEAVSYISGRGDTLALLFLCLGLLAFRRNLVFSLGCAVLAMLSKESLALFPIFLFLYDRMGKDPTPLKCHLPFWVLSAIYGMVRLTALNFENTLNFYKKPNVLTEHFLFRLYTYFTTFSKGFLLWFWPFDLHHERSWSVYTSFNIPRVIFGFLLITALCLFAFAFRKKAPRASLGILWFFAATLPTSNLFVLINAIFYDHWFILPGLGLAFAGAEILDHLWLKIPPAQTWIKAAGLLAVFGYGLLTFHYNRIWHDPISLYTHILCWEPRSAKIHNNLAMAFSERGELDKAEENYKEAIGLSDEYPQTHHNLANLYLAEGKEEAALQEFQRALEINPQFYQSLQFMGGIYFKQRRLDEAQNAFERAIKIWPYDPNNFLGIAQVYLAKGDPQSALSSLESGQRILPDSPILKNAIEGLRKNRP